ncbi:acyltransferase [Polynucleobacter sp. AP-Nino-20-G2]|uniref:acyltransferase family protein n=1 Tax=Polynucleobacter sp. AP-Nino-20-G2 TaxID=2576917 RepID=UPI001BFDD4B1|nr:acyltransferase family protein [Polynucleobacter sp. AP-Nino-20-G2]QWE17257.1 acyltransferase [Polynucleobacter sp. AP-Nino-20-G2]
MQHIQSVPRIPHLNAIDAIRCLCALYVMIGHIQPPLSALPSALQVLLTLGMSDGGWAVMIFFVISGLCIHLPYVSGKLFHTSDFLISRFCRIAIPLFFAGLLSWVLQANLDKILWSLYCEMIYYLMYPFLRLLFARIGILRVLLFAIPLALLTALLPDHNHGNFFYFEGSASWIATAVLAFPIWLLGCLLAQSIAAKRAPRFSRVGMLRAFIIILGFGLPILSFLDDVIPDFPSLFFLNTKYSFLLFSPIIYCWLYAEIAQKHVGAFYRLLSPLGVGAYSIYLMHVLSIPMFIVLPIHFNSYLNWIAIIFIALLMSILFYFLIEKPSHLLGRRYLGVVK